MCTRRETTSPSIHFPLTYLSSVYPNTWMTTLPFGSAASFTRASFTFLRQAFPKPGCFYMRCFSILQCHEIVNMITRVLNVQSGSLQVHGFDSRGEHSSMSSRLLGCCTRYKQVWALESRACFNIRNSLPHQEFSTGNSWQAAHTRLGTLLLRANGKHPKTKSEP